MSYKTITKSFLKIGDRVLFDFLFLRFPPDTQQIILTELQDGYEGRRVYSSLSRDFGLEFGCAGRFFLLEMNFLPLEQNTFSSM